MLLLPEPAAFGEDVLLLAERVVVGEEPLPLEAPGRGRVKMRSLGGPDCSLSHLIRQQH